MPRDYIPQPPTAFQRRPHLTKDDDWIRAFIKEAKIGHIATSIDGQAFINPTMFCTMKPITRSCSTPNVAGRVRSNVEANPKVSLEASELGKFLPSNVAPEFRSNSAVWSSLARTRVWWTIPPRRRLLYGLIGKYFPAMTAGKEYREITDKELRATSVYAIQIESWSGKTGAAPINLMSGRRSMKNGLNKELTCPKKNFAPKNSAWTATAPQGEEPHQRGQYPPRDHQRQRR
ncbi:MAG: hypothetical protein U0X93_02830 [Anaerolineales bacterium]